MLSRFIAPHPFALSLPDGSGAGYFDRLSTNGGRT